MTDPGLISQWEAIKLHLSAARALVPDAEIAACQEFGDYLANNELGLAHEVLEEAGLSFIDTQEFSDKKKEYLNHCAAAVSMMKK